MTLQLQPLPILAQQSRTTQTPPCPQLLTALLPLAEVVAGAEVEAEGAAMLLLQTPLCQMLTQVEL